MEYRGKQYVIFEDENSKAWIWAVTLDDETTKTGETASRGEAITKVVLAIDQAMSTARRGQSIAFQNCPRATLSCSEDHLAGLAGHE